MYLFFDTETTGLPKKWKEPVTNLDNWPRLVQIAWLSYNEFGELLSSDNRIIKPNGFIIPEDASKIHGITHENADLIGEDLAQVLTEFKALVDNAKYLVAHNMSFDEKIVGAEFLRNSMINAIVPKEKICTMEKSTSFCAINGHYGYKWPKLSELHYKLFKRNFEEAHNAAVDIEATAKCFWELKRLGKI